MHLNEIILNKYKINIKNQPLVVNSFDKNTVKILVIRVTEPINKNTIKTSSDSEAMKQM